MKNGLRTIDTRAPVLSIRVEDGPCAILHLVVRHVTPAVRPDDVLSGLRSVSDLVTPMPAEATRYAQGPLTETGEVGDPLAPDRLPTTHLAGTAGATRQDADSDEAAGGGPL